MTWLCSLFTSVVGSIFFFLALSNNHHVTFSCVFLSAEKIVWYLVHFFLFIFFYNFYFLSNTLPSAFIEKCRILLHASIADSYTRNNRHTNEFIIWIFFFLFSASLYILCAERCQNTSSTVYTFTFCCHKKKMYVEKKNILYNPNATLRKQRERQQQQQQQKICKVERKNRFRICTICG